MNNLNKKYLGVVAASALVVLVVQPADAVTKHSRAPFEVSPNAYLGRGMFTTWKKMMSWPTSFQRRISVLKSVQTEAVKAEVEAAVRVALAQPWVQDNR